MGDFVLFQAVYPYTPHAQGELALQVDDVLEIANIHVKSEGLVTSNGWLHAFNRRSGGEGYVPSAYIKQLNTNSETCWQLAPPADLPPTVASPARKAAVFWFLLRILSHGSTAASRVRRTKDHLPSYWRGV